MVGSFEGLPGRRAVERSSADQQGWLAQPVSRRAALIASGAGGLTGLALNSSGQPWGPTVEQVAALFNVRDYGATGDGSSDDTRAAQAAINAAEADGGTVFFPAGTYLVHTLYLNADNLHVRGAGPGATTIKRQPGKRVDPRVLAFHSSAPADTALPGNYVVNNSASALTIDGTNTGVTSGNPSSTVHGAVFFGNVKDGFVHDLYVKDPREAGVEAYGCIGLDISNVTVDGMLGDYQVNSINVLGDTCSGDPGYAVNQHPSHGIRIRSCRVIANWAASRDTAAGAGICILVGGCSDVSVTDCHVDLTGEPAARGRNGTGILFEGGGPVGAQFLGRNYVAANNTVAYCDRGVGAIDTNEGGGTTGILDGYTLSANAVHDCTTGVVVNGRNATVVGNSIAADNGILIGTNKDSVESNISVIGNIVRPQVGYGISATKQTVRGDIQGLVIADNVVDGDGATHSADGYGVVIYGSVHGFTVSDNIIRNTPSAGMYLSPSASLRPTAGRIVGNQLINVCSSTDLAYPTFHGVVSAGSQDVLAAMNFITGGNGLRAHTASVNSPAMTVFGNVTENGATATDKDDRSLRLGGAVTGSRGINQALASLLSRLADAQLIVDDTTP